MFTGIFGSSSSNNCDDFYGFNETTPTLRRPTSYRYYDILGVTRDATPCEIRRAFTRQAKRLHPDKGGDTDDFKALNEAYAVLKDVEKRQTYDRVGDSGSGGQSSAECGDMFGGIRRTYPYRSGCCWTRKSPRKSKNMCRTVHVTLEEVYIGATNGCCGRGFQKKRAMRPCPACNGTRVTSNLTQTLQGVQQESQSACRVCYGCGTDYNPLQKCDLCRGSGCIKERKTLHVDIKPVPLDIQVSLRLIPLRQGIDDRRHKFQFPGEASCSGTDLNAGDVFVCIECEKHQRFERRNADLIYRARIGLHESLCGVDLKLRHLDGRVLRVQSRPGEVIRPGDVKCIASEGMPVHDRPLIKGNLYIQFEVDYPTALSLEQQQALQAILRPGTPPNPNPDCPPVDTIDINNLAAELSGREQFGKESTCAYDSDNDGGPCSRKKYMQCAQQ